MVTIDKIDFSKLKPFDGKATKCFEHLCYQIAQKEYGHLGKFTPIDGSGGDGGVEFYLVLNDGGKWGWQCKFYQDSGRLNISNRELSIENSLETACRNHEDLTKWFICLKTDLTNESLSSKGKFSEGELNWFNSVLPNKIPAGQEVDLVHWGESSLVTFLKNSKHLGIRGFFFGELEFNQEWFKQKFNQNFEKVKDKYDPKLHTLDRDHKSIIDFNLGSKNYCSQLELLKDDLNSKSKKIEDALKQFSDDHRYTETNGDKRAGFIFSCNKFKNHISLIYEKIGYIEICFKDYKELELEQFNLKDLDNDFEKHYSEIDLSIFKKNSSDYKKASEIIYLISDFGEKYQRFFRNYFHKKQKALHFFGAAAKGKTHLSCDIAYTHIQNNLPTIFFTGDKFSEKTSISNAILENLDISIEFNFDEFIKSLDVYGSILKCKIPIIIDGLNETTSNRYFSEIWKNHLGNFIENISSHNNLLLITTCRSSYKNRIWSDQQSPNFHFIDGFEDYDTILSAVEKYFDKYKIKSDLYFATLDKFQDPIFLRIFCEIKNPDWKLGNTVELSIEEESMIDIFEEYFSQVNTRVTTNSHLLKENESFIQESLSSISKYLWESNLREISVQKYYEIVDGVSIYIKDSSKADILIHEGLMITRDIRGTNEYVSFTYDAMAGYIISKNLLSTNNNLEFIINNDFINKISNKKSQHPLWEDIIYSLCLLSPKMKKTTLHQKLDTDWKLNLTKKKLYKYFPTFLKREFLTRIDYHKFVFGSSVNSLFHLNSKYIGESDLELINNLFLRSDRNKKPIFELLLKTITHTQHPLNALFLSKLLHSMKMNNRDIYWTEFIRKKANDFERIIEKFETQCKKSEMEELLIFQKQHLLAKVVMWLLTSTDRSLRDSATRALYYYGRKYIAEFSILVYESLKINDPYVWERCLASLYGIVMAEHNNPDCVLKNEYLENICNAIYKQIFEKGAPYSTTHILARDYARRTIEIGLRYYPNLLSATERQNIQSPFVEGGIRKWGEIDYLSNQSNYSNPIHMDFSNYTIGRIVKDGHAYDNPPDKDKVRKQIYWRIIELGWNGELFDQIEKEVVNKYSNVGRTQRARIERYGKKYSWIAYYENAGLRDDLGLLERDYDKYRISDADIDPSFPEKPINDLFLKHDLLGDRDIPLEDWIKNGGIPFVEDYLEMNDLDQNNNEWICLDAFIDQEDIEAERSRFTVIRSLLVNNEDYSEILDLLNKQDLGGHWLPPKRENYYTYYQEMHTIVDSTYRNCDKLSFEIDKKKKRLKIGDNDFTYFNLIRNLNKDTNSQPSSDEIEIEEPVFRDFEILLSVMEYNWEDHHCPLNQAGNETVLSKEISEELKLVNQPQTFDLFDQDMKKSAINKYYHSDYNNHHSFVYLRKDLLDKFLQKKGKRLIWIIWGERKIAYKTDDLIKEKIKEVPHPGYKVFEKIVEYKS